jgi:amino acid efflux transporter
MTARPQLARTLGLGGGIALALGSIAGSGLLFLPAVTVSLAGQDVLLVWAAATVLCVPLLLVFGELVREVPDGSGIGGFVARGLGPDVAAAVPALFLAVFFPGLAAASLVAGGYLETTVGGGQPVRLGGALLVIAAATATNLLGARGGSRVQALVTWTLLGSALALFALTVPEARGGYDAVVPTLAGIDPILAGILVAFWAYAGFENMTFVAGELRNPRRDYLLSSFVALGATGVLAALLTANVAAIFPPGEVDELTGVAQLTQHAAVPGLGAAVLTVLALALVQANVSSWLWGISRLLFATARDGRMPAALAAVDARGIPRRAVLVLAVPGAAVTAVASLAPGVVLPFVVAVSAVFVFLYLLALASYLRTPRSTPKRAGAAVLLVAIAALLATRGWYAAYPVGVAAVAVAWATRGRWLSPWPRPARAGAGPPGPT